MRTESVQYVPVLARVLTLNELAGLNMICSPQPGVVNDNIVCIHLKHHVLRAHGMFRKRTAKATVQWDPPSLQDCFVHRVVLPHCSQHVEILKC